MAVKLLPAPLKVVDHVGHRWAKDAGGVYCTCRLPQRISLYAYGTCWNSIAHQGILAAALDNLRATVWLDVDDDA